jgi:hypothetical protein
MAEFVVRPGTGEVRAALEGIVGGFLGRAEAAALEAAHAGVAGAIAATDEAGLVDLGTFKRGWDARPIPGGAELFNDAPHAAAIEYGRRPGRPGPPLTPILAWVRRQLVGRSTGGRPPLADEDAVGVAWLIQRRIHARGSPPRFILRRQRALVERVFQDALSEG